MAVIELLIGLFAISYVGAKAMTNTQPDKSEDEEAKDIEGQTKHQFWQSMDYTEPWNDL